MKKILFAICMMFVISGCAHNTGIAQEEGINVIATIFPPYDFVREIAGDKINITLLIPPGSELHSYEPTPQDIIKIKDCDLFIYNGGSSDTWVDIILESIDNEINTLKMIDVVTMLEEEIIDGMQAEEDHVGHADIEYDEHIWTSPVNSKKIVSAILESLIMIDEDNSEFYTENTSAYIKELEKLDSEFRTVADIASNKILIFGDRFPFRYFTNEYNLDYYAAFPGCSEATEPNASTLTFLIDKIKSESITTVFYIEFSNRLIADSLAEATGVKTALLHSCHSVSKDDIKNGVSYISLMFQNLVTLKEALG